MNRWLLVLYLFSLSVCIAVLFSVMTAYIGAINDDFHFKVWSNCYREGWIELIMFCIALPVSIIGFFHLIAKNRGK